MYIEVNPLGSKPPIKTEECECGDAKYGYTSQSCEICKPSPTSMAVPERVTIKFNDELRDLTCDRCHSHIGWVNDLDLNGNYFFCDKCNSSKTSSIPVPEKESLFDKISKNADENERLGNEWRDQQIRKAYESTPLPEKKPWYKTCTCETYKKDGECDHTGSTPLNTEEKEGCDKHNHPDCMECFYTTRAEEKNCPECHFEPDNGHGRTCSKFKEVTIPKLEGLLKEKTRSEVEEDPRVLFIEKMLRMMDLPFGSEVYKVIERDLLDLLEKRDRELIEKIEEMRMNVEEPDSEMPDDVFIASDQAFNHALNKVLDLIKKQ